MVPVSKREESLGSDTPGLFSSCQFSSGYSYRGGPLISASPRAIFKFSQCMSLIFGRHHRKVCIHKLTLRIYFAVLVSLKTEKVIDPIELKAEPTPADEILAQSIRISINGDSFEVYCQNLSYSHFKKCHFEKF